MSVGRPIKLRQDEDSSDENVSHDLSDDSVAATDSNSDRDDGDDSDVSEDDYEGSPPSQPKNTEASSLKEISFGALAEAQAQVEGSSHNNPRKRKASNYDDDDDDANDNENNQENDHDYSRKSSRSKEKGKEKERLSRTSKHAPTVLSSKNQVSRARTIFAPSPALKSRDPRFDAAVQQHSASVSKSAAINKNYSFLTSYQAAEILDLRAQIKDIEAAAKKRGGSIPDAESRVATLKRQIMSIEAKMRNAQTRQREAEIIAEHNRQEKAALAQGKKSKPYYLKESAVRRKIAEERRESMGKRARDKADRRKVKRDKTKEAREMPRVRRS